MSLLLIWSTFLSVVAETCSLDGTNVATDRFEADCYAGVTYFADGTEKSSTNAGVYSVSRGDWLDTGNVANFYGECTVNSGSLDTNDMSSRVVMSTNRKIEKIQTTEGSSLAGVTVDIYDAVSGGTLLCTATFNIVAERTEL